ncbi:MAG: LuxR C-terminal-related transcriptional regulator, partial [Candidatus Eremiobacteraeota bacterium]|nr:LuxR C-terminal-related transcriptional regulator [Candidatus Eremiobacteraeota bacterium]
MSEICRLVPASRWAFARVGLHGEVELTLASDGNGPELPDAQTELNRQRLKAKVGPRIAAALGPLGGFESGVTLLFADAKRTFGILTLLRTAALGPFTSTEISMLSFALSAGSERFSGLRLQPPERGPTTAQATDDRSIPVDSPNGEFYVLDRDMEIVLAWNYEDQRRIALTELCTRVADRLPALLEETVRELTAGWGIDSSSQRTGIARPVPFLVVRTQPLSGPTGLFIGVRIDRFRPPSSLIGAATRFHISPREVQVLALLLDGTHLDEIGRRLHITSSTVQDHIRSMVEKTGSGNRSELIARVLGWESTAPNTPPA